MSLVGAEGVVVDNAARSPEYQSLLIGLAERNICPFDAPAVYDLTPPEDILWQEEDGWMMKRARYPYSNTEEHLMLFPLRHIVSPAEMTDADRQMPWKLMDVAREEFGLHTGVLAMRYSFEGRHEAVGGSIRHLHGHIIVPRLDPETGRVPGHGTPDAQRAKFNIG